MDPINNYINSKPLNYKFPSENNDFVCFYEKMDEYHLFCLAYDGNVKKTYFNCDVKALLNDTDLSNKLFGKDYQILLGMIFLLHIQKENIVFLLDSRVIIKKISSDDHLNFREKLLNPQEFYEQDENIDRNETIDLIMGNGEMKKFQIINDELSLENQDIYDLTQISHLTKLKTLNLYGTPVNFIEPLENLINLETLYLNDTKVSNIKHLTKMKKLKNLHLDNTYIDDISSIANLENLETLDLTRTKVRNLTPLQNLKKLKELILNETFISDLKPLRNLENLQCLGLEGTNIKDKDIASLANLENLRMLDLSNTSIMDTHYLKYLTKMEILNLSNTKVYDSSPFYNMLDLKSLILKDTKINRNDDVLFHLVNKGVIVDF